jgi:ComF family protein
MLRKIIKEIEELFFPVACVNCGRGGDWLCKNCKQRINFVASNTCYKCGVPSENNICSKCKNNLDGIFILGDYKNEVLKKVIWEYKYNFIKDLSRVLVSLFVEKYDKDLSQDYFLTAVPISRKRFRFRGFNQADLIAREISSRCGIEYLDKALTRVRNTQNQMELSKIRRMDNVSNAFSSDASAEGEKIYLVDDVVTTGSTLEECARALKDEGAKEVWGVVLARD